MKNTTVRVIVIVVVIVLAFFLLKSALLAPSQPSDTTNTALGGADQTNTIVKTDSNTASAKVIVTPELKQESQSYLARDGAYVVQYTDNGFVPREIQIPRGKSVRFVNVSSKGLQVFSDSVNDSKFVELNQSKTIGKGSTYTFSFVIEGLWAYHNQTFPSHRANVVVY